VASYGGQTELSLSGVVRKPKGGTRVLNARRRAGCGVLGF
jgi:hypothetical protein